MTDMYLFIPKILPDDFLNFIPVNGSAYCKTEVCDVLMAMIKDSKELDRERNGDSRREIYSHGN